MLWLLFAIVILIALLPTWPYSRRWGWGYYPSGGLALVVIILILLIFYGRI